MFTKKLIVWTYLQYILIVLGALLLFAFVCQLGGVFGIFDTIIDLLLMLIIFIYPLLDRERILGARLRTVPATIRHQPAKTFQAAIGTLIAGDRAVAVRDHGNHRLGYRLLYYLRQLSPFARALGRRHGN